MREYNKLVRDKITQIIKDEGKMPVVKILSDSDFELYLNKKLCEELAEYLDGENIEELVDILEVIYAIAGTKGVSVEQLEKLRAEKAEKKGAFTDKVFLACVVDTLPKK